MPTYRCPIEDCGKEAPTAGAIQGHISGTGYGPHQGESGYAYDAEDLLVEDTDGDADSDADTPDDADSGSESAAQTDTSGDSSGSDSDGDSGIVADSDRVETVSQGAVDPQCPGCGETENVQAAPAYANAAEEQLESEHVELLRNSDYVCGSCGGVWDE